MAVICPRLFTGWLPYSNPLQADRFIEILNSLRPVFIQHPARYIQLSTAASYPHVTVGHDGIARIGDSRYKVEHLAAEHYHYGWTAEELLRQHPDLRPEQVYAALAYFYDHFGEIVSSITAAAPRLETLRSRQTLSRSELLSRKQG